MLTCACVQNMDTSTIVQLCIKLHNSNSNTDSSTIYVHAPLVYSISVAIDAPNGQRVLHVNLHSNWQNLCLS